MAEISTSDEYSHFFEVRLELFDGPIDLLLHLVKQRELPIEKVSLAEVTGQYLSCIEQSRQLDLDVAGEYLVIAATLLSIKAAILLNEPVELIEDEEGNLVDPHEELLRKLREAEVYKQGAFLLSCRKVLGVDVFSGPSLLADVEPPPVKYRNHDPMLLGIAFKKLLDKAPKDLGLVISMDSVSIVDRMMGMIELLKKCDGRVEFSQLVPDVTSRSSLIASFVALLELCKRQVIRVQQEGVFEDIYIALFSNDVVLTGMQSEFDQVRAQANG